MTSKSYDEIRAKLDEINERARAIVTPYRSDFATEADYCVAIDACRAAHSALHAEAKALGFRRLFNDRYALNREQAAL